MATQCSIHLYAESLESAQVAAGHAQKEIERIEECYSRYRPGSFLSEINRVAERGGSIELDEETASLFAYARACYEKSDGLFDITSGILRRAWNFSSGVLPERKEVERLLSLVGLEKIVWELPRLTFRIPGMEVDLGGIGKEYAADRAAEICLESGIHHGLIELGGDIRVIGPHPDQSSWKIGIRNPFMPDTTAGTVELSSGGLATSSDYQRRIEVDGKFYGHLLHPKTGRPVAGLVSVSAMADNCLAAGSITTLAMLRGEAGKDWFSALNPSLRYLWIDRDGTIGGPLAATFPSLVKPPR